MKYILYTTTKISKKLRDEADIFASEISKTKGRGEVTIDIVQKIPRGIVPVEPDTEGHVRFTFDWFRQQFPKGDYDGVIFHFTPYYKRKWGMTFWVNGVRNKDNREYPEFWVCDDLENVSAVGYENERISGTDIIVTDFLRKFFHEQAHFDEDLDDNLANILTQTSVHDMDYRLKKIHLYHYLVDYRGQNYKEQVNKVVNAVIKLVKKFI